MCTPSEVLARATNTVDLDPPSYGVLKGLSKVCVAGTQILPQDFTAASVIAKSAADEMDAGLDKVTYP